MEQSGVSRSNELSINSLGEEYLSNARSYLRDDYLPKIEKCLQKLTDEQIWWRPHETSNSIGNLLLHLCGNARQWIVSGLGGEHDARKRQTEFDQRAMIARDELLAILRSTIADVDLVLSSFPVAKLLESREIQDNRVTSLEAIFHVTEHFSMHTGQIILLTKLLTESDLEFYDFSDTRPKETWKNGQ